MKKSILTAGALLLFVLFQTSCTNPANKELPSQTTGASSNPGMPKLDTVSFLKQSQVDSLLKASMKDNTGVFTLGKSQNESPYMVIARSATGQVEVHELYDDVVVVRSGRAVLKSGSTVTGEQKERGDKPKRDWFGGEIQNAQERDLSPGDFIIIPAMLAHQYVPVGDETFTYWTIKVERR